MSPAVRCLLCALSVAVLGLFAGSPPATAAEPFQHPVLRVPKLAAPPTIDGTLAADEWAGAACFTGLAATGGVGPFTLVPEVQQVVWHIGFDDRFLYLAMHSPHQKGTYPVARVKQNDSMGVLFEDHVEIQICPFERGRATRPGAGFYKIMVNPKAAMIDQHLYNGTIGTEELWSTGGETKCRVTEDAWDLEMSIEIPRLQVDKLDGRGLVIQLVRTDWCAGVYFAGWAPYPWLSWANFAQVEFDAAAPVLRFTRVGEVMAGTLDTAVAVAGGAVPREVAVNVRIENADGQAVFEETQTAAVGPGQNKPLAFRREGLALSPVTIQDKARNWFEVRAAYRDGDREVVLYHNRLPFVKYDQAYEDKYLKPWLAGRPQSGEWEYRIAYLPYSNRAEAGVDLDFFGVPAAVQAAAAFRVDVAAKAASGSPQPLASGSAPIQDMTGQLLLELPELADGDYQAVFTLLDAAGKPIADKTAPFTRKRFPFEHNRLGVNDEVIPPFSPITVKGQSFSVWGRTYTVGAGGLPSKITVGPPTGTAGAPQELLAAPVRLELLADGKPVLAAAAGDGAIAEATGNQVLIMGRQPLGAGLTAETVANVEYDGWYEVTLTLQPAGTPTIEALDLVLDLANLPTDTLYVQRLGDGRYGNRFGGIPAAPGVHFRSSELLACRDGGKDWKSFVPQTYLGNGDRGLWFFAWSDAGWELRDDQPMLTVERLPEGLVRARVRLLAGPVTLDKPRTLRFALQAAPVKPNDGRYRTRLAEGAVAHDTRGYRLYGDSVDGYALHRDEDFAALRKFLLYGPRYQPAPQGHEYGWWVGHYVREITEGARICMYGSTWLGGGAAPEHRTFGGEWFGRSNWTPAPDTSYTGRWNYQGTIQWDTPEELNVVGYNWTQSVTDFFLWYHKPLLEKAGFNGTWWDNSSIGVVREYDPELGRVDAKWNLYARRQLCKRLCHLGWELMRPPCWAMNMHVDMSFNQLFWMVENDWYADAEDMTALQQWSLDEFRAMCRTKSTTLIAKPWLSGFKGTTPELDRKIQRSLGGICLAHDIPAFDAELKRKLVYVVAWDDPRACLFTGYWASASAVALPDAALKACVYANADRKSAAVLLLNTAAEDRDAAGLVLDLTRVVGSRTPLTAARVYDLETGAALSGTLANGRWTAAGPLPVAWHEYRVLAVEAE